MEVKAIKHTVYPDGHYGRYMDVKRRQNVINEQVERLQRTIKKHRRREALGIISCLILLLTTLTCMFFLPVIAQCLGYGV
ncbi:hypothetical protein DJ568_15395 [Mucilaginibacter hurinus]|uniref:Uncharacterized protein n=1 Tax=Mucilaginibacter hurinus TaxID=2201324 RepID=A0A367GKD3_9SPHI|nr:hypothetical protein [Mucilaginibacter hurinus]RCH53922.1 hypothetical protein DJ568_15395 [Mucilaginibacter hurinus]